MSLPPPSKRCRQFCARCGQLLFEFLSSPDGHFGLVDDLRRATPDGGGDIHCSTCDAPYSLLERLSASGQPIVRK